MGFFSKLFGEERARQRLLSQINKTVVGPVNAWEKTISPLTDQQLQDKTDEFKKRLADGQTLDDILVEVFAVVREAAKRVLGQRHFDVQLTGGAILHRGAIAEMRTGEGKTLTSTLPIYLNALSGLGVHVVTVNDYLALRDACWMGQIYSFLGLSVGIIQNQMISYVYDPTNQDPDFTKRVKISTRQQSYACDITYGTNNEFGFDYLRDNMAVEIEQRVAVNRHFAIVDEIDSILIDEARTPLIISAPAEESQDLYYKFAKLVTNLQENTDYNIDEKLRSATLTEEGISKLEKMLGVENIYVQSGLGTVHHIEQALKAYTLFKRDRHYVVQDGQLIIVDEFTGRLMPGRRYSEGLHQALEAKEGLAIQRESQTLATITFQNYFRMYDKLSGMTGTALTEAEEFWKIYGLEVVPVPTNKPVIRQDANDKIYKTEIGKFQAAARKAKELQAKGQPVLIGTLSIEKNELMSQLLTAEGVSHEVLNAKNHAREAEIVAQAGRKGAVTLATNMAGRGVDIILGGKKTDDAEWSAAHEEIKKLGGLFVIGTERHESRRIDNQLRGRSGRQGDPGASQFFVSLEDELMRIFGSDRIKNMMTTLRLPEDMPIENKLISRSLESAQKKVEGHNFDIRKHLLEFDDVLNKQRETIYRRRRQALDTTADLKDEILSLIREEIKNVVWQHTAEGESRAWDLEEIYEVINSIFVVDSAVRLQLADIEEKEQKGKLHEDDAREAIVGHLYQLAVQHYNQLEENIVATTGQAQAMRQVEKGIILKSIDTLWVEHLDAMDHLRQGIGLRGYGQRDPLIEYKKEGFILFENLLATIRQQIVYSIYKTGLALDMSDSLLNRRGVSLSGAAKTMDKKSSSLLGLSNAAVAGLAVTEKPKDETGQKIGRNDPCYCGSGQKYKKCHGA